MNSEEEDKKEVTLDQQPGFDTSSLEDIEDLLQTTSFIKTIKLDACG